MGGKSPLITAEVLAEALDLSVETIWSYTKAEKIPYVKLGKEGYRYSLQAVSTALSNLALEEKSLVYQVDAKKYTYQDYLKLPDEQGFRYEVLNGQLIKEPSPRVIHQRIVRKLLLLLDSYFKKVHPDGEIFFAPLDVTLGDYTVVQPDLLFVAGAQKNIIEENRINGAPTLAVEIISESSRRKDRVLKWQIYQAAGVKHYWLVDPEEKSLECFALQDGAYILAASGLNDDVVEHPDFAGLKFMLADLWQN
ncbi:MAG: DNA-binding protein [Firmicutes bacterium]|nr:DNA-binding protein [Bacillota bacterium]